MKIRAKMLIKIENVDMIQIGRLKKIQICIDPSMQ